MTNKQNKALQQNRHPLASGASVDIFDLPCWSEYIQGLTAFSGDGKDPPTAVQFCASGDEEVIWSPKEHEKRAGPKTCPFSFILGRMPSPGNSAPSVVESFDPQEFYVSHREGHSRRVVMLTAELQLTRGKATR